MKTISTHTVPAGAHRVSDRDHRFTVALIVFLVAVAAATAAMVMTSPWSTGHSHPLIRNVGPGTFAGNMYNQQVPAAADPLQPGNVYQQQVPSFQPFSGDAAAIRALNDDSARLSRTGNEANGVKGLDDDSAALTARSTHRTGRFR